MSASPISKLFLTTLRRNVENYSLHKLSLNFIFKLFKKEKNSKNSRALRRGKSTEKIPKGKSDSIEIPILAVGKIGRHLINSLFYDRLVARGLRKPPRFRRGISAFYPRQTSRSRDGRLPRERSFHSRIYLRSIDDVSWNSRLSLGRNLDGCWRIRVCGFRRSLFLLARKVICFGGWKLVCSNRWIKISDERSDGIEAMGKRCVNGWVMFVAVKRNWNNLWL